jgi:hypothetical protein
MDLKERVELMRQTLDALERIEANGGKVPDGFVLECTDRGEHWGRSAYVNVADKTVRQTDAGVYYRLRSTTPRLVPLGPEDVPPGSVVRLAKVGWLAVSECADEGLIVNSLAPDDISWSRLMDDGWEIKRPGEDWAPCSKESK